MDLLYTLVAMRLLELPPELLRLVLGVDDTCLYCYRVCSRLVTISRQVLSQGRIRRDVRSREILSLLSEENLRGLSDRLNHFYVTWYDEGTEFPVRWTFLNPGYREKNKRLVGTLASRVGTMNMTDELDVAYLRAYLSSREDGELVLSIPLLLEVLKRRVSMMRYGPPEYARVECRRIGRSQLERCVRESRISESLETFLRYRLVPNTMVPLDRAEGERIRRERMNRLPVWSNEHRGARRVDRITKELVEDIKDGERRDYGIPFGSRDELRDCWRGVRRLRMLLRCHNQGDLGTPMKGGEEKVRQNVLFLVENCNYGAMYEAMNNYVESFHNACLL